MWKPSRALGVSEGSWVGPTNSSFTSMLGIQKPALNYPMDLKKQGGESCTLQSLAQGSATRGNCNLLLLAMSKLKLVISPLKPGILSVTKLH